MDDRPPSPSAPPSPPPRRALRRVLVALLSAGQILASLISMVPPLFAIGTPCGATPGYDTPEYPPAPILLLVVGGLLALLGAALPFIAGGQRRGRAWAPRAASIWAVLALLLLAAWAAATAAMWSDLMTFPYYPALPAIIALLFAPCAIAVLWRSRRGARVS